MSDEQPQISMYGLFLAIQPVHAGFLSVGAYSQLPIAH